MGLISKKGQDVKDQVNKDNIDLKKVYIRLKDGESIKVKLLGVQDYVQYKAHASGFNLGIYSQPCLAPTGCKCPLCTAYEYDKEAYKDLRPSYRYLVAMADLEEGMLRVWDCSKTQLKNLISQIDEYAEEIEAGDIYFTFKRTGKKTDTTYTLSPIINKKQKETLAEKATKFDDVVAEDSFFEGCLVPRSEGIIMTALKQAGLPVGTIFPNYIFEEENSAVDETQPTEDDGDMPF